MTTDTEFVVWIESARSVAIETECERRALQLSRGNERTGPCPVCGGRDRFGINVRKQVFNCRGCGRGGDVIALVELIDGCDFVGACERLTGQPPPGRRPMTDEERREAAAAEAARIAKLADERAARDRIALQYRERERERLYDMFRAAAPINGSLAARYLAGRGIPLLPINAALRFHPALPYYHGQEADPGRPGKSRSLKIHQGPAMLAAITGVDGRFRGLHCTYLVEREGRVDKFSPGHDDQGHALPAKKVRGSKEGHCIVLRRVASIVPRRLFIGEGIETVLSAWFALSQAKRLREDDAFWSSIDLGNLAGRALDRVTHPTVKDARGAPRKIAGALPDPNSPAVSIPDHFDEVIFLGDADSDPFATRLALRRASNRHATPRRTLREAWPDPGMDFNDMLNAALEAA